MKIGVILGGFTGRDGREYVSMLSDMMQELGKYTDLHVFAMRSPIERGRYFMDGAYVHAIGGGTSVRAQRIPMFARTIAALMAEHRRGHFDILHAMGVDECGFTGLVVGRLCGIARIITVMGGELVAYPDLNYGSGLTRSNRLMGRAAMRGAHRVTVAGLPIARQVEAGLPARHHGKVVHLGLGIDPSRFQEPVSSSTTVREFRLLNVAGLRPPKDQSMLLRAFKLVRAHEPTARLDIAGDGALRSSLMDEIESLGLTDSVMLHGHLNQQELHSLYRSADVFAFSSRNEGHPIAAIEAAFCGLAIVSTHVGLIADLAPRAAMTVPIQDEKSLAAALLKARDPDIRRNMAAEAERIVRTEYTAARSVQKLLALYEQVL